MNLFFVGPAPEIRRLITPPLTGLLLPGVTRDSILTMASASVQVSEEPISRPVDRMNRGDLRSFRVGTAAVVTPVGQVKSRVGSPWTVAEGQAGPITMQLRDSLLGCSRAGCCRTSTPGCSKLT